MSENDMGQKSIDLSRYENTVHFVLAHSYFSYFFLFLLGILFDFLFPIKMFKDSIVVPIGFLIIILASILIIWSQKTARDFRNAENVSKDTFCKGPYCYSRSPTHWGLFLLMLGFGITANTFFVILFTIFAFTFSRFFFLKKEEHILTKKYGTPYIEYKKSVKL